MRYSNIDLGTDPFFNKNGVIPGKYVLEVSGTRLASDRLFDPSQINLLKVKS